MELLTAIFPVARRDAVVDALIGNKAFSGFNLMSVDGFSREHGEYDLQEQVAGYRHECRVDVIIEGEQREALLDLLAGACGPGQLHYWVLPVEATGRR